MQFVQAVGGLMQFLPGRECKNYQNQGERRIDNELENARESLCLLGFSRNVDLRRAVASGLQYSGWGNEIPGG